MCGQWGICILFVRLSHWIKTTSVGEQHVQLRHSGLVLIFFSHRASQWATDTTLFVKAAIVQEYCTLLSSSLRRIPCDSQKMTGFLSCFHIACCTLAFYFQVIIIAKDSQCAKFNVLFYWPPVLLLKKVCNRDKCVQQNRVIQPWPRVWHPITPQTCFHHHTGCHGETSALL